MEDQNEKESKTSANLLYPELMSQDELIAVLKQVCLFVLQSFLYFNQRIHRYLCNICSRTPTNRPMTMSMMSW